MNAIDTNVLVYFVDEHEPAKQAKATELLERLIEEETETALLWQVAVEFASCLRRWEDEGRIDRNTTRGHVDHLECTFPFLMPSRSVLRKSGRRHG